LRTLVTHPRIGVAVLSGRSLPDIKRRISLRGVIYGGNHGLEIEGPRLRFRSPSARGFERRLRLAGSALEALVGAVPGAELERKRFAVAVHYRRVARWRLRALGDMVRRAADEHGLALLKGKKVWDVVPPGLGGKSQGVSLIQEYFKRRARRRETVMLYFGDDATDLEAFRRLRQGAISVRVGGRSGAAAFRLRGVSEVHALLRWIETAIASVVSPTLLYIWQF
jgi:trehalose-phosphatase